MNAGLYSLLFIGAGTCILVGEIAEVSWFIRPSVRKFMDDVFSPQGARVFYGALGVGLIVLGVMGIYGVIDLSN